MLAFALISYEPDFLVQFLNEGQLVARIQFLWDTGEKHRGYQGSSQALSRRLQNNTAEGRKGVGGSTGKTGHASTDAEAGRQHLVLETPRTVFHQRWSSSPSPW